MQIHNIHKRPMLVASCGTAAECLSMLHSVHSLMQAVHILLTCTKKYTHSGKFYTFF